MPSEKSVSFRTQLQSYTGDLLGEAGLNCVYTTRLIISLVSKLAAYTEEGKALSPAVYICNSIAGMVRMAGAGEYIPLSNSLPTETAASKILKAAAPLCTGHWSIFVERSVDGKECSFGVFCGTSDPTSFTVEEALFKEPDAVFPIIRVAQNVTNKVEVKATLGSCIEFRFNDDVDVIQLESRLKIRHLAEAFCRSVAEPRSDFCLFLERLLVTAIALSHGTLVAVVEGTEIPSELSDVLIVEPAVDFFDRYKLHIDENKTAVSVSRLHSASELLNGFINSDGVTILNTYGKVLGFRAFVKIKGVEGEPTGGARTRAFAELTTLVEGPLHLAFFRSQDGRMELSQKSKDQEHA